MEVIDQALALGLAALPVVVDSFYGDGFGFRKALRGRHIRYAVQLEPSTVVWTTDPNVPLPPAEKTGWPRQHTPLQALSRQESLEKGTQQLPAKSWRTMTRREGS